MDVKKFNFEKNMVNNINTNNNVTPLPSDYTNPVKTHQEKE